MKFISWNVNGLRAVGKDFEQQFKDFNADFFCLQETKMQAGQQFQAFLDKDMLECSDKGLFKYCDIREHKPLSVTCSINIDEHDHAEGRVTLEMDDFYLVTVLYRTRKMSFVIGISHEVGR